MDFVYTLILGFVIGRLLMFLLAITIVVIDKIKSKNN